MHDYHPMLYEGYGQSQTTTIYSNSENISRLIFKMLFGFRMRRQSVGFVFTGLSFERPVTYILFSFINFLPFDLLLDH